MAVEKIPESRDSYPYHPWEPEEILEHVEVCKTSYLSVGVTGTVCKRKRTLLVLQKAF
jgi:hypothetical protein